VTTLTVLRHFDYVNEIKIQSIFDQCYDGLVEVVKTKGKERKAKIGVTLGLGHVIEWLSPIKPEISSDLEILSLDSEQTKKKLENKPELQLALVLTYLEEKEKLHHISQMFDRNEIVRRRLVCVESDFQGIPSRLLREPDALPSLGLKLEEAETTLIIDTMEREMELEGNEPHAFVWSVMRTRTNEDAIIMSSCNQRFIRGPGSRDLSLGKTPLLLFGRVLNWLTKRIIAVDPIAIWSTDEML